VLSITDRVVDYGHTVVKSLEKVGVRATLDQRNQKLGFKVRESQLQKIPVLAVIGDQEAEAGSVAPRFRGEKNTEAEPLDVFVQRVAKLAELPSRARESSPTPDGTRENETHHAEN
jgi:threonyl-tRNA synthetase